MIASTLVCTGQSNKFNTKVVPDSLRCLTPSQLSRHIQEFHTLQGQATSLSLMEDGIKELNIEKQALQSEINNQQQEQKLHSFEYANCEVDNNILKKYRTTQSRKIQIQKVFIYLLAGVALTEFGYIGIQKITR